MSETLSPNCAEAAPPAARARRTARLLPVLVPLTAALIAGFWGLDLGSHWDEHRRLASVHRTIDRGVLLPGMYWWPSMSYWLTLSSLAPEIIASQGPDVPRQETRAYLHRAVDSRRFLLRARSVYMCVSALSIVWVYLVVLVWRKTWFPAFIAASLVALSWEINYHMRWIAIDVVMMQFTALTVLFAVLSRLKTPYRPWLYLAAVAAGCACGSKYPAGLLIVLVLLAAYQRRERGTGLFPLARLMLALCAVFGTTYVLITPGTILEPIEFVRGVRFNLDVYAQGHASHNVSPGLEHFWAILKFFGVALFSKYDGIAIFLSLLGIAGIYALVRESRQMAVLMLCMPALYIAYFSTQRVLIVRNLLLLAPFFAIFSALGIEFLWKTWKNKAWRAAIACAVTGVLVVNGWWLFYAADTVTDRGSDRFIREAVAYVDQHADTRFFVSKRVADDFAALGGAEPANVTRDMAAADQALFYTKEGFVDAEVDWRKDVPGNFMTDVATWFGPYEINWLLYTKWPTNERIALMSTATVARLDLKLP